ncbi:hypothetical protein DM860_000255 [Cuscuta australis]|uniref:FBD domain-containing protein n=1 Tax=Cuscuta australis TaxID=267555 RepID=A0A328CZ14_9ASTE|nr:hypothetical protein DM860_000255 [Cuscuta australis]
MDLKSICTLAFDIDSLQDFFCKTTTKGLSIQLPTLNVELLKLSGFCFQDKAGVSAFVRLLCKCPKLRSLEIKFQTVCDKWTNINKCMDEASGQLIKLSSVLRKHKVLLFLKLRSFKGLRPQMHLIQEMLGWLPALEKVVIIGCPYVFDWNKEHETMEEILQFPRASPKAKIVCK